ncbi:S4 domain-containing protein YaaA [Clostridium botulinum]|uniref:S4 domain protein YaaA n=1 Tax=Clostridium botulinum D str. 1873 TaxID=592027 RepID=A0A9P2LM39_CLOBO|nr:MULTISPECIES: S4 domain-containing protein YaaA [Clostridium]AYF53955.1 S4 domain-containing protein YaaA [Clostridium novyi]EES92006.1 S4 domain protein YaaA [Clostridium botulinum D str. 1873]MBO3441104.1 S4 domain-containing protein YaaA [Clostridium haemolyticum]MCD3246484.1 S4 domain-containing protein YaaA [Clostridium botulinum C]MCD3262847.1 S4 domain-containing protein YaaA [Clostridium botulinum C]
MQEIKINTDFIKLDAFLKWAGIAVMGSEAKFYIQNGEVKVNGEIEIRRGRKLISGDTIEFQDEIYKIV